VGRERETRVTGTELRGIVGALHAMFVVHVRADHMAGVQLLAKGMPTGTEVVELFVPGAVPAAASTTTQEEHR
jgi:phosphoribosyl 1,2-cyclic phosphodiesterase